MFWVPGQGFGAGILFVLPAMILAIWAQSNVKRSFAKYLKVRSNRGKTGYEVARTLLDQNGLTNIPIERVSGSLSDHYDPIKRIMRLSNDVYAGNSIAAVSVAAHETGHAIQHAKAYAPLSIRGNIFPLVNFASTAAWPLAFLGFLLSFPLLIDVGIILFTAVVLFQLVTLPVEFDASKRALVQIEQYGLVDSAEIPSAKKVLNAAALTYVASAAVAVMNLIRLIVLRGSRD